MIETLFQKHGGNVTERTTAQWINKKVSKQFNSQKRERLMQLKTIWVDVQPNYSLKCKLNNKIHLFLKTYQVCQRL